MKSDAANNPVVICVLVCVLFGAIVATIKGLRGDSGPVATVRLVTPAALKQADESMAEAPLARSGRNPFDHPVLRKVAAAQTAQTAPSPGGGSAAAPPRPQTTPSGGPIGKLPDLHISELSRGAVAPPLSAPFPLSHRPIRPRRLENAPTPDRPAVDRASSTNTQVPDLRLTAVVSGMTGAAAVIEGLDTGPVTVRVGDRVGEWRVTAVNAREAILVRRGGILTVPLAPEAGSRAKVNE